jgi:hypothetical protein
LGQAVIALSGRFPTELMLLYRENAPKGLFGRVTEMAIQGATPKAKRKSAQRRKQTSDRTGRRWSQRVTEQSDALTLENGVFTLSDPKRIAASLKRSAVRSKRRKAEPFRSALSMLTFYLNRAGKKLPAARRKTLTRAKEELRKQFGRD